MLNTSIHDLSTAMQAGALSPTELVDRCLQRIADINPRLNAFITVLDDAARDGAREAEAEIRAGYWRGPLHGIPVAVKDFFDTAGVQTTGGFAPFRDRLPDRDADVVRQLRDAGAILLGKTNMDSLGMATTGLTSAFGPVRNPWSGDHVSGGSSAGSAVAVATGMCLATVDTDAVGSARLPAACCGVVGVKGSYGRISLKGILGDAPVDDFIRWMAHGAVTARSVADAALMLEALTGPEAGPSAADADRGFRIGIGNGSDSHPDVQRAFDQAVAALRSAGHAVAAVAVPLGDDTDTGIANVAADRAEIGTRAFAEVDVIVLPTLAAPVPTVAEAVESPDQVVSAGNTAFANYYGLPAVSVPCGLDRNGLPIGLQFVGRPGDDRRVLSVAAGYERRSGFPARHPIGAWHDR